MMPRKRRKPNRKRRFNRKSPNASDSSSESKKSRWTSIAVALIGVVGAVLAAIIAADIAVTTDEELREASKKYVNPPSGPGPWAFDVIDTRDVGLIVRSTPGRDGEQVGTAQNRATLWVECQVVSDFDPILSDPYAAWFKVRWPGDRPGVATPMNSSPGAPHSGYVYSRYAIPAGHNGDVPSCNAATPPGVAGAN
jgi:hypothetical protein